MRFHTLHAEQYVAAPLAEVFAFFAKPENLAIVTPPSLNFRIITPSPIEMRTGAVIEYSIKVLGVSMRWKSCISTYEPMRRFVDEQVEGPYSYWHHTHTFAAKDGGTTVIDDVRYVVPFGLLGRVVNACIVRRNLDSIFSYRKKAIERIFGGQKVQASIS